MYHNPFPVLTAMFNALDTQLPPVFCQFTAGGSLHMLIPAVIEISFPALVIALMKKLSKRLIPRFNSLYWVKNIIYDNTSNSEYMGLKMNAPTCTFDSALFQLKQKRCLCAYCLVNATQNKENLMLTLTYSKYKYRERKIWVHVTQVKCTHSKCLCYSFNGLSYSAVWIKTQR